ncbi:hypothetical protein ASG76_08775 [Nocardioides sp. Soil774]|uniref:J domain-containing protein n=1 Tax=Nocardioides sp. Soil774 TaxID=1736408 RepID=UPI0006F4EF59|nr:J domain-containing protein [Nocardioides sp. Soil774]KRE95697.1 hypothetical protein ASG76_08775 [Nocardioides sp. Soil774]
MSDSPTWYDLLDVPRHASADSVRAAWKQQIADLEPGDRRFDALNRAAKVLLDPGARAAYDAALAPEEPEDLPPVEGGAPTGGPDSTSGSRGVPSWLLAGLGVVAAVLLAATTWMWTGRDDGAGDRAARDAQVAAERAVVPVLSYDYEHLDADRAAATALMTGHYKSEYDKLFAVLQDNAPRTRTKVSASVIASGVVRASDDRVQVLVFVDRPTTNKLSADPVVYKDQVTLSMQRVDDQWLVDDLITSPVQG